MLEGSIFRTDVFRIFTWKNVKANCLSMFAVLKIQGNYFFHLFFHYICKTLQQFSISNLKSSKSYLTAPAPPRLGSDSNPELIVLYLFNFGPVLSDPLFIAQPIVLFVEWDTKRIFASWKKDWGPILTYWIVWVPTHRNQFRLLLFMGRCW